MKIFFSALFLILISGAANAQVKFVEVGKIEFERKINVHRQFDLSEDDSWFKGFVLSKTGWIC